MSKKKKTAGAAEARQDSDLLGAYLLLRKAAYRLCSGACQLLLKHELTDHEYDVLRALRGRPEGMRVLHIADRLLSKKPAVSVYVDSLEGRGLVFRERSKVDTRVVRVFITEAGLALLEEVSGPHGELLRSQFGRLSAEELAGLRGSLEKLLGPPGIAGDL